MDDSVVFDIGEKIDINNMNEELGTGLIDVNNPNEELGTGIIAVINSILGIRRTQSYSLMPVEVKVPRLSHSEKCDVVKSWLSCISDLNYVERNYFGDQVLFDDTFYGKYILVVCFQTHSIMNKDFKSLFPRELINICHELYLLWPEYFEMLVALRCPDYSFSHLKDLLPFQCLVVPFEDSMNRDKLCQFLHLDSLGSKCLLVNVEKDFMLHGDCVEKYLLSWTQEQAIDVQRYLKRLAKSTWPVSLEQARYPSYGQCSLTERFQALKPEYPDDVTMVVNESKKTCPIVIGQTFDVISLLKSEKDDLNYLQRIGSDQVVEVKEETFQGKYILVCCYYVPVFRKGAHSCNLQRLVNTCSDLYSTRHDFEMVLVPKMNKLTKSQKAVFDHFMSGFLPSCPCLVVPFNDSKRRDFICKYLDFSGASTCLILDDNRSVLVNECPAFLSEHGADAFPFTREHLQKVVHKDFQLWGGPSTFNLEQLLHPSDVVDRINSAGVREVTSISELSTKLVGLFLCHAGDYIPTFHKVFEQCRTEKLPIEIVLVYMPFAECLDPQVFKVKIDSLLEKHKVYWWCLPFNNSISLRLLRLSRSRDYKELIIVGPHGGFVDLYGGKIICEYGFNGYPFTREGLVQRELKKLKEITLESLLVHKSRDFVLKDGRRIPVANLQGRNVLIYFDCLDSLKNYENLLSWYDKMKKLANFEVVFVHRSTKQVEDDLVVSIMPWFTCPFDFDHSSSVNKKLFTGYKSYDTLVQFGQDGQISSIPSLRLLPSFDFGSGAFPFGDNLRERAISKLPKKFQN